jgi:histidinol-phosphate/aromatic aminotransferase/cobyric acid decarboxylase-like protein
MDGTINYGRVQINANSLSRPLPGLFCTVIVCLMEDRERKTGLQEMLEAPHPASAPPGLREHLAKQDSANDGVSTQGLIARAEGVLEEQVVVAGGLAELFGRICSVVLEGGERVALAEPSRPELVNGLLSAGARYVDPGRGAQWAVSEDAMDRLLEDGELSMVVLGRPCAPAGVLVSVRCIERSLDAGLVVVVDESWLLFSNKDEENLAPILAEARGQRLILLRCMGASWGLDPLRAGFALTGAALATELRGCHSGERLAPAADAALRWMMEDPQRRLEHAASLRGAREEVLDTLASLSGLEVLPCEGPWLALRVPGLEGEELSDRLRGCGLSSQWRAHWSWRDAVALPIPRPDQGEVLVGALGQILSAP